MAYISYPARSQPMPNFGSIKDRYIDIKKEANAEVSSIFEPEKEPEVENVSVKGRLKHFTFA
jgi:hypothetical protein